MSLHRLCAVENTVHLYIQDIKHSAAPGVKIPCIRNQTHRRIKKYLSLKYFSACCHKWLQLLLHHAEDTGLGKVVTDRCLWEALVTGKFLFSQRTRSGDKRVLLRLSDEQDGEGTWTPNPCVWPSRPEKMRPKKLEREQNGLYFFFCCAGIYQPPWGGMLFEPPGVHIPLRARERGALAGRPDARPGQSNPLTAFLCFCQL